jgi:hypothetical protein
VTYNLDDLRALMETEEELDPELEAYKETSELGWEMIRHPLVYSVVHSPQLNAMVNESLKRKKEAVREARRQRNWNRYIFLHEKPYRIDAFTDICWKMGDSKYWTVLGDIYTDTENLHQNQELWVGCLTAERRYRSHLMTIEERAVLTNDLPAKDITLYRGFHDPGTVQGLSWTTNSVVAKFFARRLAQDGARCYVATGKVDRKDVIAFFDSRSEYEAVVLPENVRDIQVTEIERGKQ